MIIIVSPNLKKADDWARTQNEFNLSQARLFSTNVPFDPRNAPGKGRPLNQEGDAVVWVPGWEMGEHAEDVRAAVVPCITEETRVIYA